jgi:hypothetical protein
MKEYNTWVGWMDQRLASLMASVENLKLDGVANCELSEPPYIPSLPLLSANQRFWV